MPVKSRAQMGAIAVNALVSGKSHIVRLHERAVLSDLMESMGLPLTSCIAMRGGVPVPSDEPLHDGDIITLLETFSGG